MPGSKGELSRHKGGRPEYRVVLVNIIDKVREY